MCHHLVPQRGHGYIPLFRHSISRRRIITRGFLFPTRPLLIASCRPLDAVAGLCTLSAGHLSCIISVGLNPGGIDRMTYIFPKFSERCSSSQSFRLRFRHVIIDAAVLLSAGYSGAIRPRQIWRLLVRTGIWLFMLQCLVTGRAR